MAEQRKAKEVGDIGEIEKHGVFTERYALNPYNGEKVPIWVANYVLMDYGTGAIMSVPAHDERDYEFAKKYGLDIRVVIMPRREGEPAPNGGSDRDRTAVHRNQQPAHQLRRVQRTALRRSHRQDVEVRRRPRLRQGHGHLQAARLGHQPPALLGHADPGDLLRRLRHRAGARKRPARRPAGERRDHPRRRLAAVARARVRERALSQVRRPRASRNRHHGHLRRFVLVLLSLHRPAHRHRSG